VKPETIVAISTLLALGDAGLSRAEDLSFVCDPRHGRLLAIDDAFGAVTQ